MSPPPSARWSRRPASRAPGCSGVGVSVPGQVDRATGISEYAPNWDWHDVPLRRPAHRAHRLPAVPGQPAARQRGRRAVVRGRARARERRGGQPRHRRGRRSRPGRRTAPGRQQQRRRVGPHHDGAGRTPVPLRQPWLCGGVRRRARHHAEPARTRAPTARCCTVRTRRRPSTRWPAGSRRATPWRAGSSDDTARYLGAGVADLVNLFNPEVVVLSSWVAAALGEPLLAEVREAVPGTRCHGRWPPPRSSSPRSPPTRCAWARRRSRSKAPSSPSGRGTANAPPPCRSRTATPS